MNGINGHAAVPALWQEARNADGRVYYYNTITKETQWTKPEELMTPAERALANQPWKEYTAEGGRKYWYNTETKQSSWEMPDVYKEALAKEAPAIAAPSMPTFVAGGGFSAAQYDQPRDREPLGEARQIAYGNDVNGSRAQAFVPANNDPDYSTFEEAEAAFLKLLKRHNVKPDLTWEEVMRSIIKDPQYRALKDPKDRKAAFEKYAVEVRLQEKDRAKERLEKLRTDFATMLRSHPEIKHYTRWKTARPIIEGETIFRSSNDDDERRQLFEDYIIELKKANLENEVKTRKAAMDELVDILKGLDLEPYTRWSEAQGIIQSNPRFQEDEKFKSLSKSDILTAFENHIKSLEKTFNDVRQQQKTQKLRRERQNRDRFMTLLQDLKAGNKIKAGTKWSQIHPLIETDDRYVAMLGQSGSTPLDLFWDMVEEEERALRSTRNDVLDVLDLREKVNRRSEDDKHQAERHQRRAVDALRSYIKHLEPPVRVDDDYEKVRPRFEKSEEYASVATEELRRSAFDKVIRRLKEKEEDAEKDRPKRRERSSDRSSHRDRERDRGHRLSGSGRHDRRSRSPEPDAYEADRRKAIADREKNYRKGGMADTLLSPNRRDRGDPDLHDRDRDRDRDRLRDRDLGKSHRSRRDEPLSHYERERRDREDEREKMYRRRGDPRGSVDELPYGDERSSVPRKRRESDVDRRDSKRTRREMTPTKRERSPVPPRERRHRTRTPPAPKAPVKEDPAVHSGSEEGEIEEE
ncbi:formin binding protein [Rutstroemia sp. NJR-2017a BBW]|nr:formin binding protein [Rutstroemia sp. NJR-2017a BBW]